MGTPRKSTTAATDAPQSAHAVETLLGQIAALRATLAENAAALDAHVATLREREAQQRAPIEVEIARLEHQVRIYCEAHRDTLTNNRKFKFVRFATGLVSWRKVRSRVVLTATTEEILTALRVAKLKQFIRVTESIDKAAMLASPIQARRVPGVEIHDGTDETITIETT